MKIEKEWQEKYPEGCKRFEEISGLSITGNFANFLKTLRRHASVTVGSWDLTTGKLEDVLEFTLADVKKKDGQVNMACESGQTDIFDSPNHAWKYYIDRLERQFKQHKVSE